MRIGIISEGTTDQAVITNILKGLGIDSSSVIPIRPDLSIDETDKNFANPKTIGTWQGVKNACLSKDDFELFFIDSDNKKIIIQLDTAEANHVGFDVVKPQKSSKDYSFELRKAVIEKVHEWLKGSYKENLLYAIAIEEIEAWVLTIYTKRNTTSSADPKAKLQRELSKRKITKKGCRNDGEFYQKISKLFTKRKELKLCVKHNQSLSDFVEEIKLNITL